MTTGTLVFGLVNGLTIGLLAVGFVLVYRANRFLNLAHAQLGALSALILAKVVNDWQWGWWPSFLACVAVGIATGMFAERFFVAVVRRRSKSTVRLMMLTIGISDVLLALTFIPGLTPTSQAPYPEPFTSHFEVGGVVLSGMAVLTVITVPIVLVVLTVFWEYTSLGKQVRAAASNPDAARLCGISVNRVSLIVWGIAGGLSALSAIFSGPTTITFNAQAAGPFLLMLAMGAAAIGAFVSIPAAVGGGIALGVIYQIVVAETANAGTAELVIFGTILLVLLLRSRAISKAFTAEGAAVPELHGIRVPKALQGSFQLTWIPRGALAAVLALAVVFPRLPYFSQPGNQFLLVLVLMYALVGVSLTIVVGWAGQISMGSFALVGIGAFLTARWAGHAGWNLVDILVVAGLAGAVVSVVIGLPALRMRGVTLAVVTLGFAVIAPDWLFQQSWFAGSTPFTTVVAPTVVIPGIGHLDSSLDLYYALLAVLVVTVLGGRRLRRSTFGRRVIAVRDNERASSTLGIRPARTKLQVFAVSGFLAAAAGVFWASTWQSISPAQFPADASIALLALPVIGGLGSLGGAIAAAVTLYVGTFFVGPHVSGFLGSLGQNEGFLLLIAGLGVLGSMMAYPNGMAGALHNQWQSFIDRLSAKRLASSDLVPASNADRSPSEIDGRELSLVTFFSGIDVPPTAPQNPGGVGRGLGHNSKEIPLVAKDVQVRFGGISALDGASIRVDQREIVGLIGPNGAGKTTLMNVVSGITHPNGGSVQLFGAEAVGRSPQLRARLGVARSYQQAALFPGLTVLEVIELALAQRSTTQFERPTATTFWKRSIQKERRRIASEIIRSFGLEEWTHSLTAELSTGMRRICDLMVQTTTEPRLLLLDEPTAGVAQREAESFSPLIRRIRDNLGCAIVIVEHDLPLLMGLCDRVYALEAGRVIAEGTPDAVRNDPAVIASYLGTNLTAVNRSDPVMSTVASSAASIEKGSA
jgi:ABC-type branched-subunit amino acid transport system ATPase component/ABC-type branched-subunit amino acid transport system permease subunit